MSPHERAEVMSHMSDEALVQAANDAWWFTARPEQLAPPGDWNLWLLLAGRGFGKSKSIYEWLIDRIVRYPVDRSGSPTEHLVVAPSIADCQNISITGPSGILKILRREGIAHHYVKSPRPLILIGEQESKIHFVGADKGDIGRGYNLFTVAMDELCKFQYSYDIWYGGLLPALRADVDGDHPRTVVATTPKPMQLIMEWIKEYRAGNSSIALTSGSTFDNADNLSLAALEQLKKRYEGTNLGQQELFGVLLESLDGPLFSWVHIDNNRVEPPIFIGSEHKTVGIDPCLTGGEDGDLMGVVVAFRSSTDDIYVEADESIKLTGGEAARHIWRTFARFEADDIVIEDNLAKQWLRKVMEDTYDEMVKEGYFPEFTTAPIKTVHSNHGKKLRAEPVSLRYEQGRVHHIGKFQELEDEMLTFDPLSSKASPDRLDALVHACRHLMGGEGHQVRIFNPLNVPMPGGGQLWTPGMGSIWA